MAGTLTSTGPYRSCAALWDISYPLKYLVEFILEGWFVFGLLGVGMVCLVLVWLFLAKFGFYKFVLIEFGWEMFGLVLFDMVWLSLKNLWFLRTNNLSELSWWQFSVWWSCNQLLLCWYSTLFQLTWLAAVPSIAILISRQQTTDNRQQTADSGQQAADRRQTADSRK